MIAYYLFKLLDDFVNNPENLTEEIDNEALIQFSKYCINLFTNSAYSRGGRNYIIIDTEKLGKVSICKKNLKRFNQIISLATKLEQVDSKKRSFEDWLNHLCYCNNVKYKKIN